MTAKPAAPKKKRFAHRNHRHAKLFRSHMVFFDDFVNLAQMERNDELTFGAFPATTGKLA
ncbi:hypothetical protein C100_07495 [Sphingobium sp. C100]|nr:hypothetical protein C100_07495 [Sphingobium sp. C100]